MNFASQNSLTLSFLFWRLRSWLDYVIVFMISNLTILLFMSETRGYPEDAENAMLKDSNPHLAKGKFGSENYDMQFNFDVQGGPHPGYTVRFDWSDGQSCTWMRKTETPRWVSSRELSKYEGLFQDSYGNLLLFLNVGGTSTVDIFPRGHHRNNGWTLLPLTERDI